LPRVGKMSGTRLAPISDTSLAHLRPITI
jgi:hypothetical protein